MNISGRAQYYGNKKIEVDLPGIVLSEYSYHAPNTPWHYHENPYFMYVLDGNMADVSHKDVKQIATGGLMFYNWQDPHLNEKKSKTARGFHLEFERSWFEQHQLEVNLWEGSKALQHPKLHHLMGKIYVEFRKNDQYSEVAIEVLLLQLCEELESSFSPKAKPAPSWVNQLQEIIHYSNEQLTLKLLSERIGVHPVHISRAIPMYLNQSLGQYIRGQKIKKSIGLLMNQSMTLTEIAYDCGFSDQSHFTRTFKSCFGYTPKMFRIRLKSQSN